MRAFRNLLRPLRKSKLLNQREIFFRHLAQTSSAPLGLEIVRAEGASLYDVDGKEFLDLIGGISVANVGHRHPQVIAAIHKQLEAYLHIMVYGEFIETPQVQFAQYLCSHLPASLDTVYFTNSGAEAVEGAMKLAKKATNRTGMISFNRSYHGSTQGALSIIGDEYWRNEFRPLLPGILHFDYNSQEAIDENFDRDSLRHPGNCTGGSRHYGSFCRLDEGPEKKMYRNRHPDDT